MSIRKLLGPPSPQAARTLILILAAIFAALLVNIPSATYQLIGVIIAAGAPPFRWMLQRTFEREGALNFLRAADLEIEESAHNQSTDQASSGRSLSL